MLSELLKISNLVVAFITQETNPDPNKIIPFRQDRTRKINKGMYAGALGAAAAGEGWAAGSVRQARYGRRRQKGQSRKLIGRWNGLFD
jgi:hypothetical protein